VIARLPLPPGTAAVELSAAADHPGLLLVLCKDGTMQLWHVALGLCCCSIKSDAFAAVREDASMLHQLAEGGRRSHASVCYYAFCHRCSQLNQTVAQTISACCAHMAAVLKPAASIHAPQWCRRQRCTNQPCQVALSVCVCSCRCCTLKATMQ
jgi:hypothetical protein